MHKKLKLWYFINFMCPVLSLNLFHPHVISSPSHLAVATGTIFHSHVVFSPLLHSPVASGAPFCLHIVASPTPSAVAMCIGAPSHSRTSIPVTLLLIQLSLLVILFTQLWQLVLSIAHLWPWLIVRTISKSSALSFVNHSFAQLTVVSMAAGGLLFSTSVSMTVPFSVAVLLPSIFQCAHLR